jgi:hypothetical protein
MFLKNFSSGFKYVSLSAKVLLMAVCSAFLVNSVSAQTDSSKTFLNNKITQKAIGSVKRKPKPETVITAKSEDPFLPFEGKIIRNIIINKVGFEKSIYDSSRNFRSTATYIANSLHANSKEGVIRDNLFFRKNKPLNPYRLADNERHLRDLDFILDSKIEVCFVNGSEDSVDVEVFTRDVFSLGVKFEPEEFDAYRFDIYDANLFGQGQRIQMNTLFDAARSPQAGMELSYRKSSIGGTLINPSIGYSQINTGRSYGIENEHAYYLRLDRPLVSPYSRLAGSLEISKNYSINNYRLPDSTFRDYRYHLEDVWAGYNMGIFNTVNSRERHFVALRYFNQTFERKPSQPAEIVNPIYNNQKFLLGSVTFYEQNFCKTQYVYGFGRTEDIPYGKTLTLTAGWSNEFGLDRSYGGMNTAREFVSRKGNFYRLAAGAGSYFREEKAEDAFMFVSGLYYSKLLIKKNIKIRQQIEGGHAQAFSNTIRPLLTLNNQLEGFRPDSLFAYKRTFLRTETTVFTNWKILGFNFAGFASAESAFYQQDPGKDAFQKFVWGVNGGFRIRNENLIFGTIEVRGFYFPVTVRGLEPYSIRVSTNVRLKYTSTFVRPPSFVSYN